MKITVKRLKQLVRESYGISASPGAEHHPAMEEAGGAMKKYVVMYQFDLPITVEATDEDDAIDKAASELESTLATATVEASDFHMADVQPVRGG